MGLKGNADPGRVYSLSEIARLEGVSNQTVADIVRLRRVKIRKHPNNARAHAIDEAGYSTIRLALKGESAPV